MKTDQLRQLYLDFFKSKEHKIFPSDSLVPVGDPSVLFTGAGMNQFKAYFLGLKKDTKRAASCQKCLRTADLERVGKTAYHHSFFEMLGNFSFGDYFKEDAIVWGWEFVTEVLKLPKAKLWVSVYAEDNEAFLIWKNKIGLPESRVVRMGAVHNFWPSNAKIDGPNGPCGPCSEIYVGETPGIGVEIWNLVFTQFDRQSDGNLKPLPMKNIDTGMGLERTASVLQGVESNFNIDIFEDFRTALRTQLIKKEGAASIIHEDAVMDHARAVVFSIADGAQPSNEGRGYVVRKLIRLASDHLTRAGALPGHFSQTVPMVVEIMKNAYPEIVKMQNQIAQVVEREENSLLEIIKTRAPELETEFETEVKLYLSKHKISGSKGPAALAEILFKYHDTHGVPSDLIIECLDRHVERGISYNNVIESYGELIQQQKTRSRKGSKIAGEIFKKDEWHDLIEGLPPTRFLGYEQTEAEGKLVRQSADESVLIFDQTPFYAEAGGQVGDTGSISSVGFEAQVLDTQWLEKCILHKVKIVKGKAKESVVYTLAVAAVRRAAVMKNHTATHLLHSALRKVLGEHVKQSGSLVAPDYLRFDFTHFSAVAPDLLVSVEGLVNSEIQKRIPLQKKVMSKEKAMQEGAIAFFGEKYAEDVRVVTIGDFSKELCGGTHLNHTGEIESFKIISESSIQAGVRRIEAVTGCHALEWVRNQEKEIEDLRRIFGTREDSISAGLKRAVERVQNLKNKLAQETGKKINERINETIKISKEVAGAKLVVQKMDGADVDLLKAAADHLRSLGVPFAALMISELDGKITFVVAGSEALVKKGFQSGNIVKSISKIVEGNGGGRPDFAVGGGKNLSKQKEAIEAGTKEIERQLLTYESH